MGMKIKFSPKMILLVVSVILAIFVILYIRKDGSLKKADLAKICIAGICFAFLIFATGKTIMKYI
ncbi:MAG: hypothetical protein LIP12_17140 [Clostridiales bacterium]|nr:hypothetical protein [Clostridiales bacterium]